MYATKDNLVTGYVNITDLKIGMKVTYQELQAIVGFRWNSSGTEQRPITENILQTGTIVDLNYEYDSVVIEFGNDGSFFTNFHEFQVSDPNLYLSIEQP